MDIQKQVNEFVAEFMHKHSAHINAVGKRFLIPNRYTIDDIRQYVAERIISILTNRLSKATNKIDDPEKYFIKCLRYYCIEYQRMHGYTFELPKRPRKNCEEDEAHIRSYGFKYIYDMSTAEYNSLYTEDEYEPKVEKDDVWEALVSILKKEEVDVLVCIFKKNMTWSETSKHLNVPQSTCWIRKDRAIEKIYKKFDTLDGEVLNELKQFLRGNPETLGRFIDDE